MAIHKFLGNSLIKRLEHLSFQSNEDIRTRLIPETKAGSGEWVDLSGLIVPQQELNHLIENIESDSITDIAQIVAFFKQLHDNYYQMEWTWAWEIIKKWYAISLDTVTAEAIIRIVKTWQEAVVHLDQMLYEDARKEFSMASRTGFGADGNSEQKETDFEQVRGAFENNPFVESVKKHIDDKTALGDELIQRLKKIPSQQTKLSQA